MNFLTCLSIPRISVAHNKHVKLILEEIRTLEIARVHSPVIHDGLTQDHSKYLRRDCQARFFLFAISFSD